MSGLYRDEVAVVRNLNAPLAVLHGTEEQRINGAYIASLVMPTLWRGAIQRFPARDMRHNGRCPKPSTPCSRRSSRKRSERANVLLPPTLISRASPMAGTVQIL